MEIKSVLPDTPSNLVKALKAGFVHAIEIGTLQRQNLYVPETISGRLLEILEQVFLAVQVPLLLLALRRRFRR